MAGLCRIDEASPAGRVNALSAQLVTTEEEVKGVLTGGVALIEWIYAYEKIKEADDY